MAKHNSPRVLLTSRLVISTCGDPRLDVHGFTQYLKRVLHIRGVPVRVGCSYRISYGTTRVVFRVEEAHGHVTADGEQGDSYVVHCLTKVEFVSCGQKTGPKVVGLDRELAPLFALIRKVVQPPTPSLTWSQLAQSQLTPSQHTLPQLALNQKDSVKCSKHKRSPANANDADMAAALSRLAFSDSPEAPQTDVQELYFDIETSCAHLEADALGSEDAGGGGSADAGDEDEQLTGRCVLVLAPEGCGKTQLLRHLHRAFRSVLYGNTSRNFAKLFEIASLRKPCLVLIDDVDQIPGTRRLPSAFLSSPGEVVVVCTAREEAAVPAEVRQLCTARISLTMPPPHTRRSILTAMLHDAELCCSPDTLAAMVESTRGCSGQDLNDLVLDLRTECGDTGAVRRQDMTEALHKLKKSLQADAAQQSSAIVSQSNVHCKKPMKVCGYADVFSRLENYVRLTLQHSSLYEELGMSPPSRILLFGPPGCGKTWLVKALAEKYSLTVRTVTRADVFSKYFGESEQKLDEIFNKALASTPCLLHFPGFDGLASVKAHEHHHVEGRVVNLLKSRLDGTIRLKGLILVAETSRPELLDSAIIRRGRFLAYEHVDLPDEASREEIIRHCSPELSGPATATVTALTEGFTVSEVVQACREVRLGGEANMEESLALVAPSTTQASLRRYTNFQNLYQSSNK